MATRIHSNIKKTFKSRCSKHPDICFYKIYAKICCIFQEFLHLREEVVYDVRADVVVNIVENPVVVVTCSKATTHVRPGATSEPRHLVRVSNTFIQMWGRRRQEKADISSPSEVDVPDIVSASLK